VSKVVVEDGEFARRRAVVHTRGTAHNVHQVFSFEEIKSLVGKGADHTFGPFRLCGSNGCRVRLDAGHVLSKRSRRAIGAKEEGQG